MCREALEKQATAGLYVAEQRRSMDARATHMIGELVGRHGLLAAGVGARERSLGTLGRVRGEIIERHRLLAAACVVLTTHTTAHDEIANERQHGLDVGENQRRATRGTRVLRRDPWRDALVAEHVAAWRLDRIVEHLGADAADELLVDRIDKEFRLDTHSLDG